MFKPRYKKRGKLLLKGVKKFLHYKKDIIPEEKLEEIHRLRDEFAQALEDSDEEQAKALTKSLTKVCEKSVPSPSWPGLRENIEVIFVAVVIAVGIRAYFLQPFKIPTHSMQVTLNGVIAAPGEIEKPGLMTRIWEKVARGRTYVKVASPYSGYVATDGRGNPDLSESNMLLFTRTKLRFQDGRTITFPIPKDRMLEMGLSSALNKRGGQIAEGDILVEGFIESGDQVLVDKVSYHFRKPRRGEVFVFNTRGIEGIERNRDRLPREWGSQHYIKRLVGVPGDLVEVREPKLFINGAEAEEEGIRRVWESVPPEGEYRGYSSSGITKIHLVANAENIAQWPYAATEDLYWAMGDNSRNSSDSRNWGPVPERNVVGPALFVYWPFAQHWGPID